MAIRHSWVRCLLLCLAMHLVIVFSMENSALKTLIRFQLKAGLAAKHARVKGEA
jgi:hypothetical protein